MRCLSPLHLIIGTSIVGALVLAPGIALADTSTIANPSAAPAAASASAATSEPAQITTPVTSESQSVSAIAINEVVYDDVVPGTPDSIELYNAGTEAVDLDGWSLHDNKDRTGKGAITGTLKPGEFAVFTQKEDGQRDFDFGLGKGDSAVLKDANGNIVDRLDYEATAPLADWSRCPDGTGEIAPGSEVTLGAANVCEQSESEEPEQSNSLLVINEIDSSPADWVELFNAGGEAIELAGYEIRDNSDDHRWRFTEGTLEPGAFQIVDAKTAGLVYDDKTDAFVPGTFEEALGIGSGDSIRLYDPAGGHRGPVFLDAARRTERRRSTCNIRALPRWHWGICFSASYAGGCKFVCHTR